MRVRQTAVRAASIAAGLRASFSDDSKPLDPEKGWDKSWALSEGSSASTSNTIRPAPADHAEGIRARAALDDCRHHGMGHEAPRPERRSRRTQDRRPGEHRPSSIDGHYWCIPHRACRQEQVDVILDLMKFMRQPEQQVLTWSALHRAGGHRGHAWQKAPKEIQERGEGVLAARIRPGRHQVESIAAARREGIGLRDGSLGPGSGR